MLQVASKAPQFTLPSTNGEKVSLKSYLGRYVLVYFYPKDLTPGCTDEACGMRDYQKVFSENNLSVIGISADSIDSHQMFTSTHSLGFPLLSDPKKVIIAKYDALLKPEAKNASRISYLINPKGIIVKAYAKVIPKKHAEQVLKDLLILQHSKK